MHHASRQTIDAYSASPALRLRSRVLSAKAAQRPPLAVPPAVGAETPMCAHSQLSGHARRAGDPRAVLMRLREEAADEIDRLLAFLDATEGDTDSEDTDEDGDEPEHTEDDSDREEVCEDEGAEHDGREPSLGGISADDANRFALWQRVEDGERNEVRV